MTTIYYDIEEAPLLQPNEGMIDAMVLDKQIFTLQHAVWYSAEQLWKKFIRSN